MDFNGLKNKKILVVIPHQDDEIHVAGGLIEKFNKELEYEEEMEM